MQEIQFIKGTFVVMAHTAPHSSSAQGSCCTMKAQFPKNKYSCVANVCAWYVDGNFGIAADICRNWRQ